MVRFSLCFLLLMTSCFATGSRQTLVAEMNGWTLTLDSSFGAQIEKSVGDSKLTARVPDRKFTTFWDYFYLAKTLPQTVKNQKSPFQIVVRDFVGDDEHPEQRTTVTYLAAESARPVFELMLLTFRADFVPENEFVPAKEAKLVWKRNSTKTRRSIAGSSFRKTLISSKSRRTNLSGILSLGCENPRLPNKAAHSRMASPQIEPDRHRIIAVCSPPSNGINRAVKRKKGDTSVPPFLKF